MINSLFIGAILAVVLNFLGPFAAVLVAVSIAWALSSAERRRISSAFVFAEPSKYSNKIIGTYDGKPIHDHVWFFDKKTRKTYLYTFDDVVDISEDPIRPNRAPLEGEIFLSSGLVYRNTKTEETA